MQTGLSRNHSLALSLGLLALFLAFSFFRGEGSYQRINDNLDGFVPLYRVLADHHPVFGGLRDSVPQILGGLSRNSMPSTLNLGVLLYYAFEPITALLINEILMRCIAFFGMALLLARWVLPGGRPLVIHGAALCFALLPYLPSGFLSVAGQPLLLCALLEIRAGRGRWWDWLVVAAFPFYSSLVYIGLYLLLVLGAVLGYELLWRRRLSLPLVMASVAIGLGYLVSEYRLAYQILLAPDYVSYRAEFDRGGTSFLRAGLYALWNFVYSQHHAAAAQFPVILTTAALALALYARPVLSALRSPVSGAGLRARLAAIDPAWRQLFALVFVCGLIAAGVGLLHWQVVEAAIQDAGIGLLKMFNLHRIQWFHPLLFGLAFALGLELIARRPRFGPALAAGLVAAQLACLVISDDAIQERRESGLRYRDFYATALFDDIKASIDRPPDDYRVLSLGLIPGIALYNGFQVLDGFLNDYPLEYKHRLREVMAAELARDPVLQQHFDGWGSHLHLYSHELGQVVGYRKRAYYTRDQAPRRIETLAIDPRALAALGTDYLLSAVEIGNHAVLGLALHGRFQRPEAPWEIFVYRVHGGRPRQGTRGRGG